MSNITNTYMSCESATFAMNTDIVTIASTVNIIMLLISTVINTTKNEIILTFLLSDIVPVCICIYIERERTQNKRERERERESCPLSILSSSTLNRAASKKNSHTQRSLISLY